MLAQKQLTPTAPKIVYAEPVPYPRYTLEDFFETLGTHCTTWIRADPEGSWGPEDKGISIGFPFVGSTLSQLSALHAITEIFVSFGGMAFIKLRKPDMEVHPTTGAKRYVRGEDGFMCFTVTDGFGKERRVTLYDSQDFISEWLREAYPLNDESDKNVIGFYTHHDRVKNGAYKAWKIPQVWGFLTTEEAEKLATNSRERMCFLNDEEGIKADLS